MKKAMGMFAALIVSLAMTGVAFAHWSDMVYIEGQVKMGDFLVGWLDIKYCEDSDDFDKDVADVDCWLEDPEDSVHHEPPQTVWHTLVIEVTNAYPQYWAFCKVNLKNAGTIPAHIVDVIMKPGAGLHITTTYFDANGNPVGWELNDDVTGLPVLNIYLYKQLTEMSLVCNQIDPCTEEPVDVMIDVKQEGAEECHTYEFSIDILAVQWNKAYEWD